jgi:hypothetical protein
MRSRIITTITTLIDVDTLVPEHSVDISAEDALPEQVVRAAAEGALKSALVALGHDLSD